MAVDEQAIMEALEFARGAIQSMKDQAIVNADYPAAACLRDILDTVKAEVRRICREHNRETFYDAVGV